MESRLGLGIAALCGLVATIFTPQPGFTVALGLAGWPRLAVYALGGVALALTRCREARFAVEAADCAPRRAYALVMVGVGASALITAFNYQRLTQNITDPLGLPLWVCGMLVLLGYLLFPLVRRIGWRPVWPPPAARLAPIRWPILLGLILLAALIRLPALGAIPQGINPDEGDRAATAFDVLHGQAPVSWFDSGWFFINMVYFRLLAATMSVFGADVAGGRMLTALCGIGFVGAIAWIGCRNFGWRVGLLATAFAACMPMAIQHSRLITEAGVTGLLWAISIGGFLEGARTGRLWAWAVAGLAGGLGLYFYPSARLWAAGALVTAILLLVYVRSKRLLLGLAIAAVASLVAAMPFLVHLSRHPDEIAARYQQTAVLDPNNQQRLPYLTPPEPLPELFALQFERTIGLFDRYPDGGGFLPTGRPVFQVPLAQVALIGAVYLLVGSWRDVRFAVLSLWFWLGLSGVALTVETPDYLRAIGMLPSLCFVIAIPLLDGLDRLSQAWFNGRARLTGAILPAGAAIVLLVPEVVGYFTTFRNLPSSWAPDTREGQLVEALGTGGPVYSLEFEQHMVNSGWVRLLAPDAERGRLPNPGRELPILTPSGMPVESGETRPEAVPTIGQGFSVILYPDPNQRAYQSLLQGLYPLGVFTDGEDGRQVFRVSPDALSQTQGVNALGSDGSVYPVVRFGDIPPGLALPAQVTWRAGVRLPRSGTYHLAAVSPNSSEVRLDGALIRGDFVSNPGVHLLELQTRVESAADSVSLTLGDRELGWMQTYRLMDAPWGLMASLNRPATDVLGTRIDSSIAMAFFDPELGFVAVPNSIVWTGSLIAPRGGAYRMAFAAEDTMHLSVDGVQQDVVTVQPDRWASVGGGSEVQLTAGAHRVEIRLDITHGGREIARWNWVPPLDGGGVDASSTWAVVPPWVLRPSH